VRTAVALPAAEPEDWAAEMALLCKIVEGSRSFASVVDENFEKKTYLECPSLFSIQPPPSPARQTVC
jgi:hypothetical protein